MFQRRLLIVAGQLRNAQLTQPLLRRRISEDRPASEPQDEGDEFVDGEDGGRRAPVSFQSLRLTLTKKRWHNEVLYLSLILYVVAGILFYCLDAGNRLSGIVGFYQVSVADVTYHLRMRQSRVLSDFARFVRQFP